jgi:hypothetical protein
MQSIYRLEDLRRDWQVRCAPRIEAAVHGTEAELFGLLAAKGETPESRLAQASAAAEREAQAVAGRLLADCPDWLRERKLWPDESPGDWVGRELEAALQHLPAVPLYLPPLAPVMPTRSWVIAAAVGALAGMALMTPFSLLLFGQRELGLGVGGTLGAAALVGLVGALARSPEVRSVVAQVLALSAAGTLLGGIWAYWRKGSTGWLRGSLGLGAASLLLLLTRPRMESTIDRLQLRKTLQAHLEHAADLVLAWCWAHPGRVPAELPPPPAQAALPGAVYDALSELYTDLAAGESPEGLQEMVEVLFQRFEDHGYVWSAVRAGTPFDEAMRGQYEVLGRVASGQPVRTRRATLRVGEKVERKGELRRA